jgi:hypothetical protein
MQIDCYKHQVSLFTTETMCQRFLRGCVDVAAKACDTFGNTGTVTAFTLSGSVRVPLMTTGIQNLIANNFAH